MAKRRRRSSFHVVQNSCFQFSVFNIQFLERDVPVHVEVALTRLKRKTYGLSVTL